MEIAHFILYMHEGTIPVELEVRSLCKSFIRQQYLRMFRKMLTIIFLHCNQ